MNIRHTLFPAKGALFTRLRVCPRIAVCVLILMTAPGVKAQISPGFTYQGYLLDSDGAPVSGIVNLTFRLYDTATGGTVLWSEAQTDVAVAGGIFTVRLGSVTSFEGLAFDAPRWLGVQVGEGAELVPRVALTAVPYSLKAGSLDVAALQAGENIAITQEGESLVIASTAPTDDGMGWQLGGNSGTTASSDFIGTTDAVPMEIRVNGARVMRYEPETAVGGPNVVGGGGHNTVDTGVVGATIAGGGDPGLLTVSSANHVTADYGAIGGGRGNTAGGSAATVGGGRSNTASSDYATVGGGLVATAGGEYATVGGGRLNRADGLGATIGGGSYNTASGFGATVLGGFENQARGTYSLAAGFGGRAAHDGAFVWNDASSSDDSLVSTAENQFLIGATGGVGIGTNAPQAQLHLLADSDTRPHLLLEEDNNADYARLRLKNISAATFWDIAAGAANNDRLNFYTANGRGNVMSLRATGDPLVMHNGAKLTEGGTWTNASSEALKTDFEAVDGASVLSRLADLPVQTWRYKAELGVRHMGPTAEVFAAAFGLGDTDAAIATVDADGVSLAAIQALYRLAQTQQDQMAAQQARITALEEEVAALRGQQAAPSTRH